KPHSFQWPMRVSQQTSQVFHGHQTQRGQVDLRVDPGGIRATVPQVVSDFFKGEPGINQSTGAGVPKRMRSAAFPRSHRGQKTAAHKVVKSSSRDREGSERGV